MKTVVITDRQARDHGLKVGEHHDREAAAFDYLRQRFRTDHGVELPENLYDPRLEWEVAEDATAFRVTLHDAPPTPVESGGGR